MWWNCGAHLYMAVDHLSLALSVAVGGEVIKLKFKLSIVTTLLSTAVLQLLLLHWHCPISVSVICCTAVLLAIANR
jgi:hypothetical protein